MQQTVYPDSPVQQPAGERLPDPQTGRRRVILDERGLLDVPFLVLTVLLVLIGVLMMFSASYARAYSAEGKATYYFARQAVFAIVGIGIMLFFSTWNYQIWRSVSFFILAAAIVFLLLVPLIGIEENGAKRWIYLGFTSFQPSEVAKLGIVLTFASMISYYRERMQSFREGILPFVVILAVVCGLLVLEPHLSAIIIILGVSAAMLFLGGVKLRWFALGLGVVGVFVAVYLATKGYAGDRIQAWLHPFEDESDSGYQIVQSLYAIGSGGLMGLGLGRSRQKYLYLPEEHNDYIFPIVCEELGFVGAMVVLLLFLLLILRGYWIALHARDRFGMLVVGGLTTLLALQVFLNIGVVTNLLPATGISLPFFSYGGTALLIQLFEMGVILSVSRQNDNKLI
ncbi:MAG: putative lipid II flippase FtsW [Clostridiales bacterium]|nr:putative lipid II flippase FtsW [Clostridiales bacterium]